MRRGAQGSPRESLPFSLMRSCVRHWPLPRGRGLLLRLFKPLLGRADHVLRIEEGDIFIAGNFRDYVFLHFFVHGYHADPSFRLAFSLIRQGDVVFDVGANLGLWAIPASRRAGPHARVEAFEPVPENHARLVRNLALNGVDSVRCHCLAVADVSGERAFRAAPHNSAHGSLVARQENPGETVPVTSIDEHCDRHGIDRIDWLKVDVEGAESLVFAGAVRLLSGPAAPAILFEVGETLAVRLGSSSPKVKRMLVDLGYRVYALEDGALHLVRVEQEHPGSADLFAFKDAHIERLALGSLLA